MNLTAGLQPCLPSKEKAPGERRAALLRDRTAYRIKQDFSTDDFAGIALAESVPVTDDFDLPYAMHILPVACKLLRNQHKLAKSGAATETNPVTAARAAFADLGYVLSAKGDSEKIRRAPHGALARIDESFPADLDPYGKLFPVLGVPAIHTRVTGTDRVADQAFAWQRLAGANPMVLQGIDTVPSVADRDRTDQDFHDAVRRHPSDVWPMLAGTSPLFARPAKGTLPGWFRVTDQHVKQAMGDGDSLERAAAERRLFLADYAICTGLPNGTYRPGDGSTITKHLYAPLALFAWRDTDDERLGELVPIAIQCDQIAESAQVFTPADGYRWKMAQAVVQCSDANLHELVYHLPRTHLVIEAAILCARRNLAPTHPLRILLEPHFEYTLDLNDFASRHLIAPNGDVDHFMAAALPGSLTMVARSLQEFQFRDSSPASDVRVRGVSRDDSGLGAYPWRDDALEVWAPLRRFVDDYLALYYENVGDLRDDPELMGFHDDFRSPTCGNVQGVDDLQTLDDLGLFVSTLIWTATCGHGALNYAQFPMFGSVVNAPGALYAPAPGEHTPNIEASWMAMLPPLRQAMKQATVLYELSSVHVGKLGHYPMGWFADPRVGELEQELRRQLRLVDLSIKDHNRHRWMPYPYLLPSGNGQSIYI